MRSVTPLTLAAFFTLAAFIALWACLTMLAPGGAMDLVWRLKPYEHEKLLLLRPASTAGFAVICAAMTLAALGTFLRKRWGLTLALWIFIINAIGDLARTISGAWASGLFGLALSAALIWWLTRARVRVLFARAVRPPIASALARGFRARR